jgi:hypothetical protein
MHMRNSFNRRTAELGVQLAIKAVRMISRVTQYFGQTILDREGFSDVRTQRRMSVW